ncbi:nucleotidyltransferase domain-containing protein [candidate division KSB1 bacterium]|nr:nucleotidyltransferase domain-containing protein [candidate division KSB1 bacterium]
MLQKKIYDTIRKYLISLIDHNIQCQNVYLYGSYAKGNFTKDSDIDLAIFSSDLSGDRIDDQVLLMNLRNNIDVRIEPYPFLPEEFTTDNPFVKTIINTGEDLSFLLN